MKSILSKPLNFENTENHLPKTDSNGITITYRECDVNPLVKGKNRGTERMLQDLMDPLGKLKTTITHLQRWNEI